MALEPITRQEKIIAGQDLEPITRMEMFLKNFGGGGGGSVPKPLTYDYMPEGYPKKTMRNVTVMEEQELAFAASGSLYFAALQSLLDIVGGQTYTVKWDGTEHECVCSIFNGKVLALGNLSIIGMGSDTGEPFCYASSEGGFMTLDTSATHTISVKTIEETVTPMADEFLPATNALPLSGGTIQISSGGQVATLTLDEFTAAAGDVQKRGIQIGGSGAYGRPILEVTHNDITIYDSLAQRRIGGLNSEELFLKSKNSTKIFKITVDDSGTITATEVTTEK